MKIEQQLAADVLAAIKELYGQEVAADMIQLQKTKREFEGPLPPGVSPSCAFRVKNPKIQPLR